VAKVTIFANVSHLLPNCAAVVRPVDSEF